MNKIILCRSKKNYTVEPLLTDTSIHPGPKVTKIDINSTSVWTPPYNKDTLVCPFWCLVSLLKRLDCLMMNMFTHKTLAIHLIFNGDE